MVGWDEIIHDKLPTSAIIQSWRGLDNMKLAAKKGYQTMLSNGYYIDLMHSVEKHYPVDPLPATIDLNEDAKKKDNQKKKEDEDEVEQELFEHEDVATNEEELEEIVAEGGHIVIVGVGRDEGTLLPQITTIIRQLRTAFLPGPSLCMKLACEMCQELASKGMQPGRCNHPHSQHACARS